VPGNYVELENFSLRGGGGRDESWVEFDGVDGGAGGDEVLVISRVLKPIPIQQCLSSCGRHGGMAERREWRGRFLRASWRSERNAAEALASMRGRLCRGGEGDCGKVAAES